MEAAAEAEAKGEDPQAAAEKVTGSAIHDTAAPVAGDVPVAAGTAADSTTTAAGTTATADAAAAEPGTSLAHHSSFSSSSSSTAASSSAPKKDVGQSAPAKGKAKLSPEQKAQLDALEKKRDEEKAKRCVSSMTSAEMR